MHSLYAIRYGKQAISEDARKWHSNGFVPAEKSVKQLHFAFHGRRESRCRYNLGSADLQWCSLVIVKDVGRALLPFLDHAAGQVGATVASGSSE
jgi:hypothetical protein